MRTKPGTHQKTFSILAGLAASFLMCVPSAVGQAATGGMVRQPQPARWVGMNEFQVVVHYMTAPKLFVRDINIPGFGTNDAVLQMKDSFLYGLGGGVNINENWNFNGDVVYGTVKYDANWGDELLSGRGSMFNGNIGVDYNFLDGPFTPFVSGGIGFSYFDSGVPSGSPDVICWWDPWWGYVCSGSTPTHDDWSFNWKGGVGLRLDLENGMLIKVAYNVRWTKIGASGTEAFPEIAATVGWRW